MVSQVSCSFSQGKLKKRVPAVAGSFYPADSAGLWAEVDSFLAAAADPVRKDVQAVIVPHAGYVFSGATAGKAFAAIDPATPYRRVFLLGPSHRAAFDGASVNGAYSHYLTPLGEVPVDREVCDRLLEADSVFCFVPEAHEKEHCLEVELPFLQVRLEQMPPIVPVIVGTQNLEKLGRVAAALQPYFTPGNLFVVSSDFSHYPAYDDAVRVDRATGAAIASGSLENFLGTLSDNVELQLPNLQTSACGQAPIAVLLMLAAQAGNLQIRHLAYCNSGDSPYGSRDEVVGYHAFTVVPRSADDARPAEARFSLTKEEKRTLLDVARRTIGNALAGKRDLPYEPERLTDRLNAPCGAFVTLYLDGQLRGCIGNLVGRRPLYLTVQAMAKAAAFEDPRFRPLTAGELSRVHIEISVLSPLKRIRSAEEFELGRHGIFMVKGSHQGTFLPQVAEETHWTKEEFLGHCARDKAGLSWDGWRDAELYVYEAEVFDEGGVD